MNKRYSKDNLKLVSNSGFAECTRIGANHKLNKKKYQDEIHTLW